MMGIVAGWIAAGLYGLAFGHFLRGRYEKAARLFEKVCRLTPREERMELTYSYLGQCYLALEQYDKALDSLSRAYEPYRIQIEKAEDEYEQREFIKFLRAFTNGLRKTGQFDRAQEIEREAGEYLRAIEGRKARQVRDDRDS